MSSYSFSVSHRNCNKKFFFDTGVGNKRCLIDTQSLAQKVGKDMCMALPAIHAFTGCDTTSAFMCKGKLMALKIIEKHQDFLHVFLLLGRSSDISQDMYDKLEHFPCLLYRCSATSNINQVRHEKFLERRSAIPGLLLSSYSGAHHESKYTKLSFGIRQIMLPQVSVNQMDMAGKL